MHQHEPLGHRCVVLDDGTPAMALAKKELFQAPEPMGLPAPMRCRRRRWGRASLSAADGSARLGASIRWRAMESDRTRQQETPGSPTPWRYLGPPPPVLQLSGRVEAPSPRPPSSSVSQVTWVNRRGNLLVAAACFAIAERLLALQGAPPSPTVLLRASRVPGRRMRASGRLRVIISICVSSAISISTSISDSTSMLISLSISIDSRR